MQQVIRLALAAARTAAAPIIVLSPLLLFSIGPALADEAVAVDIGPPIPRSESDKLAPELRAAVNMNLKFVGQTRRRQPALASVRPLAIDAIKTAAMADKRVRDVIPVPADEELDRTDQLVVFYDRGAPSTRPAAAATAVRELAGLTVQSVNPTAQSMVVKSKDGGFLPETLQALARDETVLYVEPDYLYRHIAAPPVRRNVNQQWGLAAIGLDGLRPHLKTTSARTIVAVLDTGVELTHPDLVGNLWVNAGETDGNQRDDDGNGIIDDRHGANFSKVGLITGNPADASGHGTHCAGIIGANGVVLGVTPESILLPVKMLEPVPVEDDPTLYGSQIAAAIDFAVKSGARVINCSWGGGPYSTAILNAIVRARDANVLVVAAAGNAPAPYPGRDIDAPGSWPEYPASYAYDSAMTNMIVVAAVDPEDKLAPFSNFGPLSVHLAAPGVEIYSTWLQGGHEFSNGTSMATPFVSGAAALILNRMPPGTTPGEVRDLILKNVRAVQGLAGKCTTGGVLDLRFLQQDSRFVADAAADAPGHSETPSAAMGSGADDAGSATASPPPQPPPAAGEDDEPAKREGVTLTGIVVPDWAAGGETTGVVIRPEATTQPADSAAAPAASINGKIELDFASNPALRAKAIEAMKEKRAITVTGELAEYEPVEKDLPDRTVVKVKTIE